MENVLLIAFMEPDGTLAKAALEALGTAQDLGGTLTVGLIGEQTQTAADTLANCGAAKFVAVSGAEFAQSRYSTDAAAAEAICRAVQPTVVIAPANSRTARVMPGVAHRVGGGIDTHLTGVSGDGGLTVTRWYYRQRMEATLQRAQRPWFLLLESGCHAPVAFAAGTATGGSDCRDRK